MSTLRDFLTLREAELREQIKLLRAELAELKRAKKAIEQPDPPESVDDEGRDSGRPTIKEMVRTVFARPEAAKGLAAGEVLEAIEKEFDVKIERTSLSPQLSRLRESGDVVWEDGRWFSSEPRLLRHLMAVSIAGHQHAGGGAANNTSGEASQEAAWLAYHRKIAAASGEKPAPQHEAMLPQGIVRAARECAETLQSGSASTSGVRKLQLNSARNADRRSDDNEPNRNWGTRPKTE